MSEQDNTLLEDLGGLFLIFLVIVNLFEIEILILAYLNADEVECSLLWGKFTYRDEIRTKNDFVNITQTTRVKLECYINGEKVNCSEINNNTKIRKFLEEQYRRTINKMKGGN